MSLALARKYRPQSFPEVIGQDVVTKTLKNSIELSRLHHAYLFSGVRGVGKTSMARILAKSLNCEKGPSITPCQTCQICESITSGHSLDVIEIDGASHNLVDDVRELREHVKYRPQICRYKIIIIDEVHMLSNSAFNALLKTLEEPPAHVIFVFATTEPHKIPVTILSRCQKYDFRKVPNETLITHLKNLCDKEKIKITEDALATIASCSGGSVRDSLSLLDQMANTGEQITESLVRENLGLSDRLLLQKIFSEILNNDLKSALKTLTQIDQRGIDLKIFSEDLLRSFRNLILYQSTEEFSFDLNPSEKESLIVLKDKTDLSILLAQSQMLLKTIQEISVSDFPKTVFEILLVKLTNTASMITLTDLVQKLSQRSTQQPTKSVSGSKSGSYAQSVSRSRSSASLESQSTPETKKNEGTHKKADSDPTTEWYNLVRQLTAKKPNLSMLKEVSLLSMNPNHIKVLVDSASQSHDLIIERIPTIQSLLENHFGHPVKFEVSTSDDEMQKKKS